MKLLNLELHTKALGDGLQGALCMSRTSFAVFQAREQVVASKARGVLLGVWSVGFSDCYCLELGIPI